MNAKNDRLHVNFQIKYHDMRRIREFLFFIFVKGYLMRFRLQKGTRNQHKVVKVPADPWLFA